MKTDIIKLVPSRPQSIFRNPYKLIVYEGFFIIGGRIGGHFYT